MSQHKIIFTGPAGAGTTTAITSLCAKNSSASGQPAAGIGITDFDVMHLDGSEAIHLYGVAADAPIELLRDTCNDAIGLILLIDNTRPEPFQDMRNFLDIFGQIMKTSDIAIGITKIDLNNRHSVEDYHLQLKPLELNPPVFAVNTGNKHDVSLLVQALIYSINPGLPA